MNDYAERPHFSRALDNWRENFSDDSTEVAIINHLLSHCQGWHNAAPLTKLGAKFGVTGHWIQHKLILPSRKQGGPFIGTCHAGAFVIRTLVDVNKLLDFYQNRIAAEQCHCNRLIELSR